MIQWRLFFYYWKHWSGMLVRCCPMLGDYIAQHIHKSWPLSFCSAIPNSAGNLLKGSNMIVCVLLVSNSLGCCLAAGRSPTESPPPPAAKMRVLDFAGDGACEIELRQTGVISFPWRQRSWSCGVFKSWIVYARCPFQWKWQVLHNYDISVLQQLGMFFDGIACLMKVWPFLSGSSLVSRWHDAPLVNARIFKCDVADVNK